MRLLDVDMNWERMSTAFSTSDMVKKTVNVTI